MSLQPTGPWGKLFPCEMLTVMAAIGLFHHTRLVLRFGMKGASGPEKKGLLCLLLRQCVLTLKCNPPLHFVFCVVISFLTWHGILITMKNNSFNKHCWLHLLSAGPSHALQCCRCLNIYRQGIILRDLIIFARYLTGPQTVSKHTSLKHDHAHLPTSNQNYKGWFRWAPQITFV